MPNLVPCINCGMPVSSTSLLCSHCGRPAKRQLNAISEPLPTVTPPAKVAPKRRRSLKTFSVEAFTLMIVAALITMIIIVLMDRWYDLVGKFPGD